MLSSATTRCQKFVTDDRRVLALAHWRMMLNDVPLWYTLYSRTLHELKADVFNARIHSCAHIGARRV